MKKLLFVLCLVMGNAWAATYYVDCDAGNNSNDGLSTGAPKLTVGNITQGAGDIINIKGGTTCDEMITIGANNVTVQTYSTGEVTINATGQNYGISSTDRTGLTVTGPITINTATQSGVLVNCSVGNTSATTSLDLITVNGTVGNGATIGNGFRWFCADVTIDDSSVVDVWSDSFYCDTCDRATITDWYTTAFAQGDANGDGIQIVDGDDALISGGTCIHDGSGTKLCIIQSSASSVRGVVRDNYVLGGVDSGISWVAPGGLIYRNYVKDVFGGADESGAAIAIKLNGDGQKAYSNIINGAKKGFFSTTASTSVQYFNNTLINIRDRCMDANTANTVTLVYRNNHCSMASGALSSDFLVITGAGVTETLTNNSYDNIGAARWSDGTQYTTLATWKGAGYDANSIEGDPKFAGGASPTTDAGFRLNCVSTPLDRVGVWLGQFQDYGNRAFSNPPTIGAWECASGDSRPTSTARSTVTAR